MSEDSQNRPFPRTVTNVNGTMRGVLLVLLIIGTTLWPLSGPAWAQTAQAGIDCAIQSGPCTKSFAAGTLTLDINPKPVRAMENLTFTVTFSGVKPAHDPFIDLAMPGMIMGPNRVVLKRAGDTTYQGTGVIVRCPSGRRTWKATVTVPDRGSAEFIFDVVY